MVATEKENGVAAHDLDVTDAQVNQDWLAALGMDDLQDDDPDALTTMQVAEILGFKTHGSAKRALDRGVADGSVETWLTLREGRRVRVYRLRSL